MSEKGFICNNEFHCMDSKCPSILSINLGAEEAAWILTRITSGS